MWLFVIGNIHISLSILLSELCMCNVLNLFQRMNGMRGEEESVFLLLCCCFLASWRWRRRRSVWWRRAVLRVVRVFRIISVTAVVRERANDPTYKKNRVLRRNHQRALSPPPQPSHFKQLYRIIFFFVTFVSFEIFASAFYHINKIRSKRGGGACFIVLVCFPFSCAPLCLCVCVLCICISIIASRRRRRRFVFALRWFCCEKRERVRERRFGRERERFFAKILLLDFTQKAMKNAKKIKSLVLYMLFFTTRKSFHQSNL